MIPKIFVNGLQQLLLGLFHFRALELRRRHGVMTAAAQHFHDDLHVDCPHGTGGDADLPVVFIQNEGAVHPIDAQKLIRRLGRHDPHILGGEIAFRHSALFIDLRTGNNPPVRRTKFLVSSMMPESSA